MYQSTMNFYWIFILVIFIFQQITEILNYITKTVKHRKLKSLQAVLGLILEIKF